MFSSLKTRLLAISLSSIVLAMAALATANYVTASKHDDDVIKNQIEAAARSNASSLVNWVRAKNQAVSAMADAVAASDPMPILKAAHTAGNFDVTFIGYADKRHVFSNPEGIPADYDPTSRPWYKLAIKEKKPVLTQPYRSATDNSLVVTFAQPHGPADAPEAVLAADIGLNRVIKDVAAIRPTANSYGFLVSGEGMVIAHPDEALATKSLSDVSSAVTVDRLVSLATASATELAHLKGREVYLHAKLIDGTDWILVIALDREDAEAGLVSMIKVSAMTAAAALLLVSLAVATMVTRSLRRLDAVRNAMQDVASGEGDLTIRIEDDGQDELAQIAKAYNQFAAKLAAIIGGIRINSESVMTGATEIAQGNQDLSSRTESQASALEETASSMEELTSTVKQNADNAKQANQLALSSAELAEKGGAIVGQVVNTMDAINTSSSKISDITSVIDGIAFQTNILALNAAVEAARAGDAGRGFAVVASEVRTLAQRSAQAAKEIKGLITNSTEQVAQGVQLVQQAGSTMTEIVGSIKRVTDITSEITAASQEQSAGIVQVNQAISQMDAVTQQNAALVEEAAAAAASLQRQAEELTEAVGKFKLDDSERHTTQVVARAPIVDPSPMLAPAAPVSVKKPSAGSRPEAPALSSTVKSKTPDDDGDWIEF